MNQERKKLSINLVTYNGQRFLPACLRSLMSQTFKDFSLLVIDNGSSDKSVSLVKEIYSPAKLVAHPRNLGFAQAHNQAIDWTDSDYVMVLNQDVILEPDYLERVISFLDDHPEVAGAAGKILRWDAQTESKTNIIDSAGLRVLRSHRVVDIGQGQQDEGQFETSREVFGLSGSLPIYRRSFLDAVKIDLKNSYGHQEYFDENFFSYKEDVDLAFRLRLFGAPVWYLPVARAYHCRSARSAGLSDRAVRKSRKDKDRLVRIYSYKNHLLTIFKNEFLKNLWRFFWPIFWYEFKKLAYILVFEQSTLKGLKLYFKQKKNNRSKRRYIFKHLVKIKAEDLAKWYE